MPESKELFKQINCCSSCHAQQNDNNVSNTSAEAVTRVGTTASTIGRSITIKSHGNYLRQKQQQQRQQQQQKQKLLLITMTLAALLPMPEARHVHRDDDAAQKAYIDYSSASSSSASSDSSVSSSSESSSAAAAANAGSFLPAWQANPLLGLGISYEEAKESRSSSSASLDDSDNLLMNESTYDEIVYKATDAAMRALRIQRLRWRRRRSNTLDLFEVSASNAPPTWQNPCSGEFDPKTKDASKLPVEPSEPSAPFVNLKKTVLMNFHNAFDKQNVINTSHIKTWRYYRHNFKFLRKIRNDSNICLKCWYRNFETFIASFDTLGRMLYMSDKSKAPYTPSVTTHELYDLLRNARQVLCQIENAINVSYAQNYQMVKLKATSREEMSERLNFVTKIGDDKLAEADLVYTKHRYIHHLKNMHIVLGTAIRTNNLIDHNSTKSSSKAAAASSSASSLLSSVETSSSEQQSNGSSSASISAEHKTRKSRRRKLTRPTKRQAY